MSTANTTPLSELTTSASNCADFTSFPAAQEGRYSSGSSSSELEVKIASTPGEVYEALRLVYASYRHSGLVAPNRWRLRVTPYQLLPQSEIFVALEAGRVVCTMTLVQDGPAGLPLESNYITQVCQRRQLGISLAEVSSLADVQSEDGKLRAVIQVMSLMAQCARYRGVDELLITVHPRHVPFYERFIGFEAIGDQTRYEAVCGRPAVAMSLDLNLLQVSHPRAYRRFFGAAFPDMAFEPYELPTAVRDRLTMILSRTGGESLSVARHAG